jgi:polyphenol oxidase
MEIIRSKLLSAYPEIIFGMSTRNGGVSPGKFGLNMGFHVGDENENVHANRKLFFNALGVDVKNIVFPQQEHTNNVHVCDSVIEYKKCDALVTSKENVFLAISIADCTPVILFDPILRVVAGIHAGWKGTSQRITEKAVNVLKNQFGVLSKNIIAFVGPSAGICCYEVGEEVAIQFPSDCVIQKNNGKYLLDVKQTNMHQLLENGVLKQHIEVNEDCTISRPDMYHSFRRDGKGSGRMLAVIGIKK